MRAAKKRGEHLGRPSVLSTSQIREAKKSSSAARVRTTLPASCVSDARRYIVRSHERRVL